MKVIFFGTTEFGIPSLKKILEEHTIPFVITIPDRKKGRGYKLSPSPIKKEAEKLGIPVLCVEDPIECLDKIKEESPTVCVSIGYGKYIPSSLFKIPSLGFINLHPSLLPKYRGPAPIRRAIMEGEKEFGITIHFLDEGVDTGDIVAQKKFEFDEEKDWGFISETLAEEGALLLSQTLRMFEEGKIERRVQDHFIATYARKIKKEECKINWGTEAEKVHNLIRALSPYPGAYTYWRGKLLKIYKTFYKKAPIKEEPGKILVVDREKGICVACKDGVIYIMVIQLEGRKKMSSSEFILGSRIEVGEVLG